jgi:hypothetical protein
MFKDTTTTTICVYKEMGATAHEWVWACTGIVSFVHVAGIVQASNEASGCVSGNLTACLSVHYAIGAGSGIWKSTIMFACSNHDFKIIVLETDIGPGCLF